MSLVVDASVAVKWLLHEEHWEAAARLATVRDPLIAPELMWLEVVAALRKRVRRGDLERRGLRVCLAEMRNWAVEQRRVRQLVEAAADLALELDHGFYDCVYLALAQAEDCAMVTADARLHRKVEASRRSGLTRWIEDAA